LHCRGTAINTVPLREKRKRKKGKFKPLPFSQTTREVNNPYLNCVGTAMSIAVPIQKMCFKEMKTAVKITNYGFLKIGVCNGLCIVEQLVIQAL
jgi:hypothetical protein